MSATLYELQQDAQRIPVTYQRYHTKLMKTIDDTATLVNYINMRMEKEFGFQSLSATSKEQDKRSGGVRDDIIGAVNGLVSAIYSGADPARLQKAEGNLRQQFVNGYIFCKGTDISAWQIDEEKISAVIGDIKTLVEEKMDKTKGANAEASGTPHQSSIGNVHADGKGLQSASHQERSRD